MVSSSRVTDGSGGTIALLGWGSVLEKIVRECNLKNCGKLRLLDYSLLLKS